MFISKLNFKRGISKGSKRDANPLHWQEAQIEITLNEGDNPDLARETANTYFKAWGLSGETTIKTEKSSNQKKICAWEGCNKEIDSQYRYCYEHFQKVRNRGR